jgi:hypothetical protein
MSPTGEHVDLLEYVRKDRRSRYKATLRNRYSVSDVHPAFSRARNPGALGSTTLIVTLPK